jgi:hypothetical protein
VYELNIIKFILESTFLGFYGMMSYLTNYGQKKSINNIQDLGLLADNRHF